MKIEEFCKMVKEALQARMGGEAEISVRKIMKNNGVELNSIVIAQKDRNVSPNLYMEEPFEAYCQGESFEDIVDGMESLYEQTRLKGNVDMSFFLDYEKVKDRVAYKLIHREKNESLLKGVPYIPFLDLAIVFYCCVVDGFEGATVTLSKEHLSMWGITAEHLFEDAKRNTRKLLPPRILPIEEVMKELFTQDLETEFEQEDMQSGESTQMYVAGNRNRLFGAAVLFYEGLLKEFAQGLGYDLFILPSSIHEILLIPDDGTREEKQLYEMVCEINRTQVEPEDVLSDSLYYYSRKGDKISRLYG